MSQKLFSFIFFFTFFLFYSPNIFSTVYVNTDIISLSRDSELACFGAVKGIKPAEIEGRKITQLTFECEEPAKGKKGIYTYHLLDLSSLQGSIKSFSSSFERNPTFKVDQKYFLFFYPPHPVSHLTSPVGGEQGVFRYHPKVGLINSFQNQNLFPKESYSSGEFKPFLIRLKQIQSGEKVGLSVREMIELVREVMVSSDAK